MTVSRVRIPARRDWLIRFAATALTAAALPHWARAQPTTSRFPERPISLLVPFAPGGIADLTARAVAEQMGRCLGQPVVAVLRRRR